MRHPIRIVLCAMLAVVAASVPLAAEQTRPLTIENADAGIVKATISGPEFGGSTLFVGVEDPASPLAKRLRSEYRLDDVVAGETSEFRKMLKLRHWVHSRWHIDNDQNFNGDVFAILEKAKAGEGFNCSHAMKVQHAVMTAMGFVVRDLGVQCNTEEYPDGFHHGVNEVWSNELAKWVLLDGEYDFHFERDGQVLSALEAHEAARRDGGRGVVKVQGLDRTVVPMKGLGFPFTSVIGYWWTAYHVRQNTFTQPSGNESRMVIFDNEAFRQTTWYRKRGDNVLRKHWAYDAKAFVPTTDRRQIEWTPGVPELRLRQTAPGELDVRITSDTPNVKITSVRINGGDWTPTDGRLAWKLRDGDNRLEVRTRNLLDVDGPIVTAAVTLKRLGNAAVRPNVLLIASDDMRPQLGCYGDPTVKSPQLDALAKRGMVFARSYVQQALCSPSRISMLSGRYPATTGIFEIGRPLRATMPDITTLPQHFKNQGYHTRSLGKIYHVGIDDDASWTVPAWHSKKPRYGPIGRAAVEAQRKDDEAKGIKRQGRAKGVGNYAGPALEIVDCGDDELLDGDTAAAAIAQIREHAQDASRPFFLAVGFANPHVPWVAPRKYWERYNRAALPLATNEFLPKGAPAFATTAAQDFPSYGNVPEGELPEAFQRECLHGYLAAISYVDAQVGRLLAALDETGLAGNTIVVFWSDHGYYMGEHTWWGMKHNNYEGATRNCLIISQPGMKQAGTKTMALAQSVDLAPTLTELCGLPAQEGFQGRSLKPVLEDPAAAVNDAAFSWYPKEGWLGVAMRTDPWRYIEWTKAGEPTVRELYDMARDPQNDVNVADKPEHAKLRESLSQRLREQFPVQEFKPPPARR